MSENKTQPTDESPADFIAAIPDPGKRADCEELARLMTEVTGDPPIMWGPSIVGFGRYRYRYDSGREGDWPRLGFSPRKANIALYLMGGFEQHAALLDRLGRHTLGKGCLYIKRLSDVDRDVLRELLAAVDAGMPRG